MVNKREIASAIIFTVITCGIYGIYWFIKLTDEINILNDDTNATSGAMAFIFSLVSCGIYGIYWMYKMGDTLDSICLKNGNPAQSRGILYLILSVFGLGIISFALMQDSINKLVEQA